MLARALDLADKALTWFEEWTLYLCVMVGLVSLFINVVLRYGFHYSLAWSEELIREIIIYTTFVGCSTAIKNRSQITIDVVVQLVPRLRRPLALLCNLAVLAYCAFIVKLGWDMAAQQVATGQKTIILEIPMVVLFAILPLMGLMMAVRTAQVMHKDWMEARGRRA